jgi:glycosyltransferase involved in cell wall biosynthesis
MQILFVHPNFPAQFGPVLSRLAARGDIECVFATKGVSDGHQGVRRISYEPKGGATQSTHYCSRTFENAVWNAHAVYEACKAAPNLRPDLIVGHSGFGTTVFLRELYDCPIINLFEYFYRAHGSDLDFRPDFPTRPINYLRSHARNAMILLDLETCAAGYAPTPWQRSLLPEVWRHKIDVIHDGVDMEFWTRRDTARRIAGEDIPAGMRVVTYVARGLESMRGFDIFVRVANRIAAADSNVLFVVVGADSIHYGNDLAHVRTKTFREHVLLQERPDLSRFRFLGAIPKEELVSVFSLSDLHIYLTVPFVLSWSLLNAMACECVVLASDTAPVRDAVQHEQTGLLADFYDIDSLASQALRVLADPAAYRPLASRARQAVQDRFSLETTFPKMWEAYQRVLAGSATGES